MKKQTKIKISKSLRKHYTLKRQKHELAMIITVMAFICYFFGLNNALASFKTEIKPVEAPRTAESQEMTADLYYDEITVSVTPRASQLTLEEEIKAYIAEEAPKHGIDSNKVFELLDCENKQLNPKAKYYNSDSIKSVDRGIFQINSYWHREVSDQCAYDWKCNTNEAFRILKQRGFKEWTCGKILSL
jgi:hypothetical protein